MADGSISEAILLYPIKVYFSSPKKVKVINYSTVDTPAQDREKFVSNKVI